ncbi:MAG TPA: hypothetical protein VGH34_15850 [Vicinamibacterales bacterium]
MTSRIGIELSPVSYRIVEVADGSGRDQRSRPIATDVLPASGLDLQARLSELRDGSASVVIWNRENDHRQVMVAVAPYEAMRTEAMRSLTAAGVRTDGMWMDIAPSGPPQHQRDGQLRRPVIVTLAPAAEMKRALEPLIEAGIRVRTVVTPGAALGAIAWRRHLAGEAAVLAAYVVLEPAATCVALARDGLLLAVRDLAWGYRLDGGQPRNPAEIAGRLGDELSELFAGITGSGGGVVGQVCVGGGYDELSAMTAPLMERLDLVVEILEGAAFTLALAAVEAGTSPINLLRARRRSESGLVLAYSAVGAGLVAGLALGLAVTRSPLWREKGQMVMPRAASRADRLPIRLLESIAGGAGTPLTAANAVPVTSGTEEPTPKTYESNTPMPADPVLPLDADLRLILYAPGRRLAIINGRILALGDLVGAARIIDITTEAVLLRDPQGQTRKLVLGAFTR